MIGWLLERLAHHPGAGFYRTELEARFPIEFAAVLADGLLRPIPFDLNGTYTRNGQTYSLVERDGQVEAWAEDEPEAMPLQLGPGDLARFDVDLSAVAARLRRAGGLDGASGWLDRRMYLLGAMRSHERHVDIVLEARPLMPRVWAILLGGDARD